MAYDQLKTRLSESQAEVEELNQSQSRLGLLCDWFILPLLLPTPTIWLSLDSIKSGLGRRWKRSDSSDSDSVKLMTLLTTQFFDFHKVIGTLTTPLTTPTPTPLLMKTCLQ